MDSLVFREAVELLQPELACDWLPRNALLIALATSTRSFWSMRNRTTTLAVVCVGEGGVSVHYVCSEPGMEYF